MQSDGGRTDPVDSAPVTVVRAPGSSANLGSGFDVIGLAVDRHVTVNDHGAGDVCGPDHIARIAYDAADGPADLWFDVGDVPPSRGLGFSAAARAAGAVLARLHAGDDLETARARAYEVVFDLEGHGDNAAPAVFGGTHLIAGRENHRLPDRWPGRLLVWVPDTQTSTDESRACLDPQVSRDDAIHNLGRFGLLIHAIHSDDLSLLGVATEDRLHQPCRFDAAPHTREAADAALAAGATAAWLSGSGPTVAIAVDDAHLEIVRAALPPDAAISEVHLDIDGAVPI